MQQLVALGLVRAQAQVAEVADEKAKACPRQSRDSTGVSARDLQSGMPTEPALFRGRGILLVHTAHGAVSRACT